MRKNFGAQSWIYPLPVMVIASYDADFVPDAMVLTWGGVYSNNRLHLYISSNHKTTENILLHKAFTVSFTDASHIAECDYLGMASGKDTTNKLERVGLHTLRSELVDAPIISDLLMSLECRLESYDEKNSQMIAEIENVSADESIVTDGHIDTTKFHPITFDTINNLYIEQGDVVGRVFLDGKKYM